MGSRRCHSPYSPPLFRPATRPVPPSLPFLAPPSHQRLCSLSARSPPPLPLSLTHKSRSLQAEAGEDACPGHMERKCEGERKREREVGKEGRTEGEGESESESARV